MKTLTFFNNKGGVGTTLLVYHLSWMYAELGINVVAVDLDPQSNLTSAFLSEDQVEKLWGEDGPPKTVGGAIQPLQDKLGDLIPAHVEQISERIGLVPGDLRLSLFEDRLSDAWGNCLDDNRSNREDAFRVITAFYRIMAQTAEKQNAQLVLIDVGPNLGALNRAALVASDFMVVPLAADLFSLHGMRNLGPTLRDWRKGWVKRKAELADSKPTLAVPGGMMTPAGYVVMQPSVRERYPVKAYRRWTERIPNVYHKELLEEPEGEQVPLPDPSCLATLKNYRSLAPLAQDKRKPMFMLTPSDGALGGHANAVESCYSDFEKLAKRIAKSCKVKLPKISAVPASFFA